MKLLFDQNLSPRLKSRLTDLYPDSDHVSNLGLDQAHDNEVWEYARDNDFVIVSKDTDFSEMSVLRGYPPKVVWIRRGNCSTDEIESILRQDNSLLDAFVSNASLGVLLLY